MNSPAGTCIMNLCHFLIKYNLTNHMMTSDIIMCDIVICLVHVTKLSSKVDMCYLDELLYAPDSRRIWNMQLVRDG